MIIFDGLTKTYNKNKPAQVEALKGISCSLPNRGMVFVVGKSGCGKSTFLNVLGLLDGFDEGNILWDGESIKGLSERQCAQHRNLNIGFVFQEYNLLERYTVSKNIELALELQHERNNADKIKDVLRLVELDDMKDRKAEELSGGQKQRVAIARAIVKKPKLLLCDEPTGALDFETGQTIFSILKKISKESLVVVVSHDKEAAKQYADKIIELSDGRIINETDYKSQEETTEKYEIIDKKCGNGFSFIHTLKLATSYLFRRPIRMTIALLLCVLSFVLLSLSNTFSIMDQNEIITKSLYANDISYLSYKKQLFIDDGDAGEIRYVNMSNEDLAFLKDTLNTEKFTIIYQCDVNTLPNIQTESSFINSNYYHTEITGFAEISDVFLQDYGYQLYGKLPTSDDEIVITRYMFDIYREYGYEQQVVTAYEDLLGKPIDFAGDKKIIVGIIDTKFNEERYSILKQRNFPDNAYILVSELNSMMEQGLHNIFYLREGYHQGHKQT